MLPPLFDDRYPKPPPKPLKTVKLPEVLWIFPFKNKVKNDIFEFFPGGGRETVKMTPFWGVFIEGLLTLALRSIH